jgi:PIN domain nuclease of toxin-antitoxin system
MSPANLVFASAASVWELEIKRACGKLDLPDDWVGALDAAGFVELPVIRRHAMTAARLPWHHRDLLTHPDRSGSGRRFALRDGRPHGRNLRRFDA